jgi:hypothetical protein
MPFCPYTMVPAQALFAAGSVAWRTAGLVAGASLLASLRAVQVAQALAWPVGAPRAASRGLVVPCLLAGPISPSR